MHNANRFGESGHPYFNTNNVCEKIQNLISHMHRAYHLLIDLRNCKHQFT